MRMPELDALRTKLEQGGRIPAVLVAGGDEAVREGAVEAVGEALRRSASALAIVRLDVEPARSDAWARIADAAAAVPLFGEGTLAVVSGCDAAKVPEELKAFLAAAPEHLRLVLLAEDKAKSGPLQKAVDAAGGVVVVPPKIKDNQAVDLVQAAAREAGLVLDSRAAAVLADMTGTDRFAIDTAVRALLEYRGVGQRVVEDDLKGLVHRTKKSAPWDLDDAIAKRDLAVAVKIVTRDLSDARRDADVTIVLLHRVLRNVRKLLSAKALVARRADDGEAMSVLGLKVPFQWERLREGAARYTELELEAFLKAAPGFEVLVKRGNVPPETAALNLLSRLIKRRRS